MFQSFPIRLVSLLALCAFGSAQASSASPRSNEPAAQRAEFRPVDVNKLPSVIAAPIFLALAEAYRDTAEAECDPATALQDKERSYLKKHEAHKLMFNWYGRIAAKDLLDDKGRKIIKATGDNSLLWAARSRMMECYLNAEGTTIDIPKAQLFAQALIKQQDDQSSQAIGHARLGQILCLGLGPNGLNWKQYEIGREHMGAAINQTINKYAHVLGDLYDGMLLAHGEGWCRWIKEREAISCPSLEIRLLEELRLAWPKIYQHKNKEELALQLEKIEKLEWLVPMSAGIFRVATFCHTPFEKLNDPILAHACNAAKENLVSQEFMPYIRCWALSRALYGLQKHRTLEATAKALIMLAAANALDSIAVRSSLGNAFVLNRWSDLFHRSIRPLLLEVMDGLYEALKHADASLKSKTFGLHHLANIYQELSQLNDAENRSLYLQRAIQCLDTMLANPENLSAYENWPGEAVNVRGLLDELGLEPTGSNNYERAIRELRDRWQNELLHLEPPDLGL